MEYHSNNCPCNRIRCKRYRDCDACREHHAKKLKSLPVCERKKAKEGEGAQGRSIHEETGIGSPDKKPAAKQLVSFFIG